jgi:glycosyltransferase involved in cell wall biosynthesis
VIIHKETGWLVPPDAPAVLSEAIITLLGDEKLQHKLRRQARIRVVNNYSLAKMADRLVDLYRQVLEGGLSQI